MVKIGESDLDFLVSGPKGKMAEDGLCGAPFLAQREPVGIIEVSVQTLYLTFRVLHDFCVEVVNDG